MKTPLTACNRAGRPDVFRNSAGFTLVEVIVAAVILFSVLVIGAVAHQSSMRIIEKSAAAIAASDALPTICENIKSEMFDKKDAGEGQYGKNIVYVWSASDVKSSQDILGEYSESTGGLEFGRFYLTMKAVTLRLTTRLYGQPRIFTYAYKELVWFQSNQIPQSDNPLPMNAGSRALP